MPVIYLVGAGLQRAGVFPGWVAGLTPVVLLLSAFLAVRIDGQPRSTYACFAVLAIGFGYGIEWVGVRTGIPFGVYRYLDGLGPLVFGVPPIIGVNWFLLTLESAACIRWLLSSSRLLGIFSKKGSTLSALPYGVQAALGATLMTAFDWLMEPAAVRYGYWEWQELSPPFMNYLGWWIGAFVLHYVFASLRLGQGMRITPLLFISNCLFFLLGR